MARGIYDRAAAKARRAEKQVDTEEGDQVKDKTTPKVDGRSKEARAAKKLADSGTDAGAQVKDETTDKYCQEVQPPQGAPTWSVIYTNTESDLMSRKEQIEVVLDTISTLASVRKEVSNSIELVEMLDSTILSGLTHLSASLIPIKQKAACQQLKETAENQPPIPCPSKNDKAAEEGVNVVGYNSPAPQEDETPPDENE